MPGLQAFFSLLQLVLIPSTLAYHNKWWSCNAECARCVRMVVPMEELIVTFYPGLFSQTPPENIHLAPEIANFGSSTLNSGTAKNPWAVNTGMTVTNVSRRPSNPAIWEVETYRQQSYYGVPPGCCETEMAYITPSNVTIRGQTFKVVHLKQAFQFIPIGKCKEGSKCTHGECVEQNRAHWVLVYNTTKPHLGPPVSFTAMEVPSHCECLNVGRP